MWEQQFDAHAQESGAHLARLSGISTRENDLHFAPIYAA